LLVSHGAGTVPYSRRVLESKAFARGATAFFNNLFGNSHGHRWYFSVMAHVQTGNKVGQGPLSAGERDAQAFASVFRH